jgi:HrpA-like RNA helicase
MAGKIIPKLNPHFNCIVVGETGCGKTAFMSEILCNKGVYVAGQEAQGLLALYSTSS